MKRAALILGLIGVWMIGCAVVGLACAALTIAQIAPAFAMPVITVLLASGWWSIFYYCVAAPALKPPETADA